MLDLVDIHDSACEPTPCGTGGENIDFFLRVNPFLNFFEKNLTGLFLLQSPWQIAD